MHDRTMAATTAAAMILWPLGLALILLNAFLDIPTGQLGIYAACAGAVLNVRGFFAEQQRRERNAFEIGRDYAHAEVRHLGRG